jgi:hypothetical protein
MCTSMSPPISARPCRDAKQRVCNLVPDASKPVSDSEHDMDTCRDQSRIVAEKAFNLTLHSLLTSHAHNRTRINSHVLGLISPRIAGWWHFCTRRAPGTTHCGHGDFESLLDAHTAAILDGDRSSQSNAQYITHNVRGGALDVTHEDDVQPCSMVQCSAVVVHM